uniref:EF-hand domain-containing protein n=1 Tax=Chromera velia CCMP2878 TaxID=1169474 RepID=A0A0G4FXY0_9ALVE|eukprot:Cvel_19186.t1-p1 / transcript=Cvel_19186.t1 / gene=Cvel_19186 / organism=Chromera_velia_CCMP2878 / gene_product=hypothetical protein / transcript_product=hypothetical protein / location=Cvel_scaffold1636:20969-24089(-) / protein_length=170 / sequence_SO=supercontig / SO=protein_coding / is_pseudo=false
MEEFLKHTQRKDLRKVFKALDKEATGYVSVSDLGESLEAFGFVEEAMKARKVGADVKKKLQEAGRSTGPVGFLEQEEYVEAVEQVARGLYDLRGGVKASSLSETAVESWLRQQGTLKTSGELNADFVARLLSQDGPQVLVEEVRSLFESLEAGAGSRGKISAEAMLRALS